MAYQALYRKWRPANFDEVVAQEAVVTTLKNQIKSNRIGHAYLFCGTRGTGKTSAAKIFARAVNCPHAAEHDGNPCNECEVCKAISSGRALNVFEIDAASNNGVDNIRDIREQVEFPPITGRYKVYIIDEVHMLSPGAFNALLKTLEEPPEYVIFILATTDPQKIPATVLSRCQRYDFRRMSKKDIAGHLEEIAGRENIRVEEKALEYIAEAADGSMRDSLSILDQCLAYHYGEVLTYDHVLEILGAADNSVFSGLLGKILDNDIEGAVGVISDLISSGREISQLINDFIWYLRDVLLVKSVGKREVLDLSEDNYELALADAGRVGKDRLTSIITSMAELANRTRFSSQKRVQLEVEIIRLCTQYREAPAPAAAERTAAPAPARTAVPAPARSAAAFSGSAAERPAAPAGAASEGAVSASSSSGNIPPEDLPNPDRASAFRFPENFGRTARPAEQGAPAGGAQNVPEMQRTPKEDPASARIRVDISDSGRNQDTGGPARTMPQSAAPARTPAAAQPQVPAQAAAQPAPENAVPALERVKQNWNMLIGELSASNRPLFTGITLKEERGNIVLLFRNNINFTLAAKNAEENGLIRLRELALSRLGLRVNFLARIARPGEIDPDSLRATSEELAKINFPISIED